MEYNALTFHFHGHSFPKENVLAHKNFTDNWNIIQTDLFTNATLNSTTVTAIENKKYPIWGTIYHPEFQIMNFDGPSRFVVQDTNQTQEIAYSLSKSIHDAAMNNTNKPAKDDFYELHRVNKHDPKKFMVFEKLEAYSYAYMDL